MSDINYTWKVNNVKCYKDINGYQDYVYQTYWNCAANTLGNTGQSYEASFAGATPLGTGAASVTGYAFKPFADLTQDDVLNWIWASLPVTAGKDYYEPIRYKTVAYNDKSLVNRKDIGILNEINIANEIESQYTVKQIRK